MQHHQQHRPQLSCPDPKIKTCSWLALRCVHPGPHAHRLRNSAPSPRPQHACHHASSAARCRAPPPTHHQRLQAGRQGACTRRVIQADRRRHHPAQQGRITTANARPRPRPRPTCAPAFAHMPYHWKAGRRLPACLMAGRLTPLPPPPPASARVPHSTQHTPLPGPGPPTHTHPASAPRLRPTDPQRTPGCGSAPRPARTQAPPLSAPALCPRTQGC